MLKFTYLAQLGLAGTVLVPAVVLNEDPAGGLTDALANTHASIESLERLHSALTEGDYSQVAVTIGSTEAPAGEARARDEHLAYLRDEVSRLQMRWDAFEAAMSSRAPSSTAAQKPTVQPELSALAPTTTAIVPSTTGLDQGAREELVDRLTKTEPALATAGSREKTSYEPSGFSAHAVRHGRALYKARRYEEALSLLNESKGQAGARFWIARSLEQLGRIDEAIEAYGAVTQSPLDQEHAEDAQLAKEFLLWKRKYDKPLTITDQGEAK